jgi:hypothetical protein
MGMPVFDAVLISLNLFLIMLSIGVLAAMAVSEME